MASRNSRRLHFPSSRKSIRKSSSQLYGNRIFWPGDAPAVNVCSLRLKLKAKEIRQPRNDGILRWQNPCIQVAFFEIRNRIVRYERSAPCFRLQWLKFADFAGLLLCLARRICKGKICAELRNLCPPFPVRCETLQHEYL